MRLMTSKALTLFVFLAVFLGLSCTFTPWHRQQSEIFLKKGISFLENRQYNRALKEFLESEKYYSGNPQVHYYLGMTYHGKGMKDKAVEELKKAISLDQNYSEAHNYLGTLYAERNRWDDAIEEYEKALSNHVYETPSMALYNMAWAYYSKKDYKTALAKYQDALNVEPGTGLRPQIEKNVGLIYYDQNEISEAIRHLRKAIELDALLFDAYFILGQSYLKVRDTKNARKAFEMVIELAPESSLGSRARNYLQSLR